MSFNLGELFVQIGVKGDSKALKQFADTVKKTGNALDKLNQKLNQGIEKNSDFAKKVKGSVGSLIAIATAVTTAYWALDKLTESLAKQNLQWLNLTRQSDIALDTFQKWGTIGKIVGVDNAAQQLENLNQKIFNLRLTGEGAKGFQMAGIMPTTADDVLEQLRTRISGMSNTTASYLLQQMGLDPKMITLLRMGRKEWEQYLEVQRRYTLNKEQREKIDYYNRQLEVARIKFGYLKDRVILALMPAFTKFTQSLVRITELITKFLEKSWRVLGILTLWGLKFKSVRDFLALINSSMGSIITKIPIFGRAFAQIGKVFSRVLFPLTALYLLLDDLAVFFEGGDSLIGRVLDWGKGKFGDIGDAFGQIFGGDILSGILNLLETFLDIFNDIAETLSSILENIVNFLTFGLSGKMRDSKFGQFLFPDVNKIIEDVSRYSPRSAMSPTARYLSSTTNKNTTVTNAPQVTVFTTADTLRDIYNLPYLRQISLQP